MGYDRSYATTEPENAWAGASVRTPRVLIYRDMEGLSGQDDWRSFMYGYSEYAQGQELLVSDLNAVIDGLFAAGWQGRRR